MEIFSFITLLFYIYIVISVIYLLLDNREPASTIAWMLIFVLLPIVGIVVYIFFGRNLRTSRKKNIVVESLQKEITQHLKHVLPKPKKELNKFSRRFKDKMKLVTLLRNNCNSLVTTNNKVQIFRKGKAKYDALIRDIKNAKKYIHMEYYLLRNDELTNKIKDELIKKAKEGVEVFMLYDKYGSLGLSKKFIAELKRNGVRIYSYFNFFSPFKAHNLNFRNHRKIAVIDGKIAYTGGMNLAQEYIDGGDDFPGWRDMHIRIEGQAVTVLQGIFLIGWYNTTKEKLFSKKYIHNVDVGKSFLPMQVISSGPDSPWASIQQQYFALINSAKKNVFITSPYFIPDSSIVDALKTASLSGVDVRIMIPGIAYSTVAYWSAFTFFKELLRANVRIFLYQRGFMHAKLISVDGEACSIGSGNLDIRSFNLNYEVNTMIYDRKIAKGIERDFMNDLKYCKEFTLMDEKKMPVMVKLRNSIVRLLSPIL